MTWSVVNVVNWMDAADRSRGHDGRVSEPLLPQPLVPASPERGDRAGHDVMSGPMQRSVYIIGSIVALMWAVELVDVLFGHRLDRFGVRPHRLDGLDGIVTAPFLHSSWAHLIGNTVPFAAMGWVVLAGGVRRFVAVSLLVMVGSGAGIWLFGQSGQVHIGASGMVFGYLGYLLLRGVFERRLGQLAVGVLVGVIYGGLLRGVLPTNSAVSWQGHLFGFAAGVGAAWLLARGADRSGSTAGAGEVTS